MNFRQNVGYNSRPPLPVELILSLNCCQLSCSHCIYLSVLLSSTWKSSDCVNSFHVIYSFFLSFPSRFFCCPRLLWSHVWWLTRGVVNISYKHITVWLCGWLNKLFCCYLDGLISTQIPLWLCNWSLQQTHRSLLFGCFVT